MREYAEKQSMNKKLPAREILQESRGQLNDPLLQMASLLGNQGMLAFLEQQKESKPSATGKPLSDVLREKFERKSGVPLDDVRVHYNSDKPEQLGAEAYAQGNKIFIGPGHEQDLEHEIGHVVQQKQGLVKATGTEMGIPVNKDTHLESTAVLPNKTLCGQFCRYGKQIRPIQMCKGKKRPHDEMKAPNAKRTEPAYTPYLPQRWDVYKNFKKGTNCDVQTPFGKVHAVNRPVRGPHITSKQTDYENVNMGNKYCDYFAGLKSGKLDDKAIADALLNLKSDVFKSPLEKRAAAMMFATVYLAEEQRKQGAQKIFRAFLRSCSNGETSFTDEALSKRFEFRNSAMCGRRQVARFKALSERTHSGRDLKRYSTKEAGVARSLSPFRTGDYDSDDELRNDKKLKRKRIFTPAEAFTPWSPPKRRCRK